ncbi:MAG: DNA-binding protein [bacterium]|nr:DNA-binding protein [bacterium]
MKRILQDNNTYVISLSRGEELIEEVKKFCEEYQIEAAFFHAIGATSEVELAWYDLGAKQYVTALFQENLEIVSLAGNVSKLGNDMVVHGHGVFSNKAMETKAGHVNKALISGACEIILTRLEGKIDRFFDEDTGLNLMR